MRAKIIALLGILGLIMTITPPAEAVSSVSLLGFHPSITSQPADGKHVWDLAVHNNEIYIGYGNYSLNTGPIDVATYDPATGQFGVKWTANTESINTFRVYNGHLYVPWIDTHDVAGVYSSDQNGSWADFGHEYDTEHVFDIAVLPNGVQVAVGSANDATRTRYLGAVAWVSRDDGRTWTIEQTDLKPGDTSVPRYYWVAVINGKAYMQARGNFASYGSSDYPLRVFDGDRWTSSGKSADLLGVEGREVEVFQNQAYDDRGHVFNGKTATTRGGIRCADLFVDQQTNTLYALDGDQIMQRVQRTKGNLDPWVVVAEFAPPAGVMFNSLAVYNDRIYLGGSDGGLYVVN